MPDAFIYDHVRTPRGRGKADGALHEVTALNLAAQTLAALKARNELDTAMVDDVVLGCVDPVGEAGGDIARAAAIVADYGNVVPGVQINRFCASGLDAVNFAAAQVMSGQHDMAVGGGVELMSRIGIGASGGAWPVDPSIALKSYFMPQGISADLIATKYGFTRAQCDEYAVESQKRTAVAWQEGYFGKSVVPVKDPNGLTILARDEHPRPDTNMQSLAALKPSFVQMGELGGFDAVAVQAHPEVEFVEHVHHAGNSSGIVDGAAAVLIGSRDAGRAAKIKPRAKIRAFANIGSDPALMLTGPIDVTEKVLKRAKMKLKDIDLIEVNEAFAAVVLALPAGVQGQPGQGQRQRRRDRDGASARRHRRHDPRHRDRRARAPRSRDRAGDALHRRRHGHRDHHRAGVSMPKIDIAKAVVRTKGVYPQPYRSSTDGREKAALGNVAGLTQFGVNLTRLKPGAASALRHWHEQEDEFIYVLDGELTLIEDGGETLLGPGDCAGFKAGVSNGHQLVNKSQRDARYLEIGTRAATERAHYPDVDLVLERDENGARFLHKSGEPYPQEP